MVAPSSRLARQRRQAEITFLHPGKSVCLALGALITSYLAFYSADLAHMFFGAIKTASRRERFFKRLRRLTGGRKSTVDRQDLFQSTWEQLSHCVSLSLRAGFKDHTVRLFFTPSFYFSDQSVISPGWLSGSTFRTVNLTSTKVVLIKDDPSCERTCLCAFL